MSVKGLLTSSDGKRKLYQVNISCIVHCQLDIFSFVKELHISINLFDSLVDELLTLCSLEFHSCQCNCFHDTGTVFIDDLKLEECFHQSNGELMHYWFIKAVV